MKYDVKNFTLDEKIRLLEGRGLWHTDDAGGKLKSLLMMDGPHGLRLMPGFKESPKNDLSPDELAKIEPTAMPTFFNIANSWSTEAARIDGDTIADDCIDFGVDILLAPGTNMKRSPVCGRNFEYFSEDPYLAGQLARSFISGVQGKGVGTSLKHFCANNSEFDREHISSEVDERTLRELYLPAFETALSAKPWTVMCSYNLINGVYASESEWLLKDILRGEFGFDGLIVSDWDATREAWRSVKATLDLCMPENCYTPSLRRAYDAGIVTEEEIDARVIKLLELIEKTECEKKTTTVKSERHERAVALAKESFVLLKNEGGILPLRGGNVQIAEWMKTPPIGGTGAALVKTSLIQTKLTRLIKERLGDAVNIDESSESIGIRIAAARRQSKTINHARKNDVTILCVGNDVGIEGEGYDRENIKLPYAHEQMIINTAKQTDNLVVLVYAGSAIDMSAWIDKVRAVVLVGFAGEGVNEALADVLVGRTSPSGKLSETFPLALEDAPVGRYTGNGLVDRYTEGVFMGYRWYDSMEKDVLFPFGHGLSYANFEYSELDIKKLSETDYEVSYTVTNTSDVDAMEISQLYVKDVVATVSRPEKELKGFDKTLIPAHSSRRITLPLSYRSFAFYSIPLKRWQVENGEFEILVGASSRDIRLAGSIEINLDERTQMSVE